MKAVKSVETENNRNRITYEDGTESNIDFEQLSTDVILDAARSAAESAAAAAESARTLTIDPTLTQSGQAADAKVTGDEITDLKSDLRDLSDNFTTVTGTQLIDKTKAVTGIVLSGGSISTDVSYSGYLTSDYIPVTAETTYTLYRAGTTGVVSGTTRMVYCLFDANKSALSYFNNTVESVAITPSVDGYVRVCMSTNNFNNQAMLVEGTTLVGYQSYAAEIFVSDDVNPINTKAVQYIDGVIWNILSNKKWAHCGDSFSSYTNASFDSGTFSGKNKVFSRIIAEKNDMTLLETFMASGKTMAYPSDGSFTNSLTCPSVDGYFQNIPSDADYITIMLGINDVNHANGSGTTEDGEDATGVITLGTIDDTTTETYCGAYNTVLGWLRENRPFAHIGIIVTNGTQRQDYTEAQINIAKKWGYPYINLNGDERTPAFIRCYNANMSTELKTLIKQIQAVDYDGTETGSVNLHPNYQTHEAESTIIEAWLRSL